MKAMILAFSIIAALLLVSTRAAAAESPGEYDLLIALSPSIAIIFTGIVGFLGIIHGHGVNARHALDRGRSIRAGEARALALALSAEVLALKLTLDSNHTIYEKSLNQRLPLTRAAAQYYMIDYRPVFTAALSKLGLLGGDLAKNVVHFYSAIASDNHAFELIVKQVVAHPLDPDSETDQGKLEAMRLMVEKAQDLANKLEAFADKHQNTN